MLLGTEWTFLNVVWEMLLFSLFVLWIAVVIYTFIDNFRRRDHSGFKKAIWAIFIIFMPFLGVLVYIIARPAQLDY